MVQFQKYLKTTTTSTNRHLPLLNSLFVENFTTFNPYSEDNNFKTYMKWARRSPQLMGFLNIIVSDILSDDCYFEPLEKESGRNKIQRAQNFLEDNDGKAVMEEMLYDFLITGIGYTWVGKLSETQLKEFCNVAVREVFPMLEKKEREFKAVEMLETIKSKEAASTVKKWRHIAASTVMMQADSYSVKKYIQRVGVDVKEFSPDDIIVYKFMPLDGKIYPYAPLEGLLAEIYLLWLISQNYISYFENGGKPDTAFILPKELAGSKNHAYLIETLQKYKKIENKHGNLVFTGDLTIEQLMKAEQNMEHKELALYIVGVLAQYYGIPVGRIPFLVGKASSGGDAGGISDSGYWRRVSVWQSKIEQANNTGLWKKYFGVRQKFKRGYLQDEVRETQNEVQRNSIAEQRIRLGLWTVEEAGRYLGIDEDEIAKAQAQKKTRTEEEMKTSMMYQEADNNGNVQREEGARTLAKQKQDTQNDNQKKAGGKKINP